MQYSGQGLSWWRERFGGADTDASPAVDLPDHENGGRLAALNVHAERTEAEVLCAAFAYTLGKFSCQEEALLWVRERDGWTHPVELCFDEDAPAAVFLDAAAAARREALAHAGPDEEAIAAETGLQRELLLSLDASFVPEAEAGACPWRLCLAAGEDHLTLWYREGWYLRDNMRRLAETAASVAAQLRAVPRLRDLTLVNHEDLALLERFAGRAVPPAAPTVNALLTEAFRRWPERTAVVCGETRLTYARLAELSDRLAARLAALGAGPGCAVAILLPRCAWMPVAAIAALKTGACYQPLDPSYPPERLAFMLRDSAARVLVADRSLRPIAAGFDGPVVYADELERLPAAAAPAHEGAPSDPFVLLYTSGTTGEPKGVTLTHGNLVNFIAWYRRQFDLTPDSRAAAYASFGFDASLMDTYPILCAGGQLHILEDPVRLDLKALNRYFTTQGITHAFMTTQVCRQFALMTDCPSLRVLAAGGETLVPLQPPEGIALYNGYGPTECTIFTTVYRVTSDSRRMPIGAPVDNARLYVADRYRRLLPVGAMGELLISGALVGAGYLNRPEQTAEAFVENPFTSDPAYGRLYRTGDIVRWGRDGNVEFIGRRDGQVKIRGFRVELSEVERVLRAFPGVTDATVVARDAPAGGRQLCAYVVSSAPVDRAALERFILERKPPYMVPAAVVRLDRIPLNVNGKVDRRALPAPEPEQADSRPEAGRPRTELEQAFEEAAAPLLGLDPERMPLDVPLEQLGLTSVSALMLAVALEERLGRSPDVGRLARGSLLALENQLVRELLAADRAGAAPAAQPARPEGPCPLTQTQLGVYAACLQAPESDAYQLPFLYRLSPDTDTARLRRALEETFAAHSVLNCRIRPDRAHTAVMEPLPGAIAVREEELTEAELAAWTAGSHLLRLEEGPLCEARVFRTEKAVCLWLNFHHIVFDGTSLGVFLEDLEKAFQGETLSPEAWSAFDIARDEAAARAGAALAEAKTCYDRLFEGVAVNSLPAPDFPGGEPPAEHVRQLLLGDGLPERVRAWCEGLHVTENAFFTFAFAYLLARVSGREEALFCGIYNGRRDARALRTVGMLVKTYPFHLALTAGETPADGVRQTASRIRELTDHDLYSFAEVSRAYGIRPDILFAYQGEAFERFTVAGQPCENGIQALRSVQAPLAVDIFRSAARYDIRMEYESGRYTAAKIDALLDLYGQTVRQLLTARTLEDIDLMTDAARRVLREANDTDWPVPCRPAHSLLEAQARRSPDHTAVVTPTQRLTYAELNRAANRAAHALIRLGARPGRITALMLPRCAEVYIARQAILKAGSAFLAVSPGDPEARAEELLRDSGAALLVVTERLRAERKAFFDRLAGQGCLVVTVEELIRGGREEDPGVEVPPDALAYVIYTSGSTGKPKGVAVSQRSLVNFVDANPRNREVLGFTERGHVSLALAAMTFDVSVMEELIPLAHGLTICLATEEEIHNPAALAKLMTVNRVDVITSTPSFLLSCLAFPAMREALRGVAVFDVGAESFPAALYEKLRALSPEALIMNGYGPSETTISCTMDPVTTPAFITVGRPAANVRVYVLDRQGQPLPPLVSGELVIAGAGVAQGYLNLPEQTAEKFFTLDGLRAYRTGDVASWSADGRLCFHGRRDSQVKLRGLRVELDEIERALGAVPGVLTSAVVMAGGEENPFLAGYYTAAHPLPPETVRAQLSRSLTAYMVPGALTQLDEMPLTPNGKIDRRRLPPVEQTPGAQALVPPANALEADFCRWFAEVLSLDQVSAEGNFFQLGGTSLSAAVVAMSAAEKGYPIVYADLFRAQTPRALAALAAGQPDGSAPSPAPEPETLDDRDLPLQANRPENLRGIRAGGLGNLLLTGATGFLGVHVLREFLEHHEGQVWCLLRGANPRRRLNEYFYYYFERSLDPELESGRLQLLSGDITDRESLRPAEKLSFDTLINCAALVKHFVRDDSLERVNVAGVRNLIDLCRARGARLIQTSTVSVAGEGLDGTPPRDWMLTEDALWHGQLLDNAYMNTKFRAEQAVLTAIRDGLDAKILRLGNLMGRHSDGEFQINFRSNAFIRSLASYKAIGAAPFTLMSSLTDLSEIDMTARAVTLLSGTDRAFTVFHPMNNHFVTYADLVGAMQAYGFRIDLMDEEDFQRRMEAAGAASGALIAYRSREGASRRYELGSSCDFTSGALLRLGFRWPVPSEQYITQMLRALDELNMFG